MLKRLTLVTLMLVVCMVLASVAVADSPELIRYELIDADNGDLYSDIPDGAQFYLGSLPPTFTIIAIVSDDVESVMLDITGDGSGPRVENVAPYVVSGDKSGDYNPLNIGTGNFTLTGTPYTGNNALGSAGITQIVNFDIFPGTGDDDDPPPPPPGGTPEIVQFNLIDASDGSLYSDISEGAQFYIGSLPEDFTIVAIVAGDVESVVMDITGDSKGPRTENVPPYALAGDKSGDFNALNIGPGNYTLTGTPYSGNNASGTAGTTEMVNFDMFPGTGDEG